MTAEWRIERVANAAVSSLGRLNGGHGPPYDRG